MSLYQYKSLQGLGTNSMLAFQSLNHWVFVYLQRSDSIAINSIVCHVMLHPNSRALPCESLAHTLTCALLVMSWPLNPKRPQGGGRHRLKGTGSMLSTSFDIVQHISTRCIIPNLSNSGVATAVPTNNVLLVKIEGPIWYTIYHHLPAVKGVNNPLY